MFIPLILLATWTQDLVPQNLPKPAPLKRQELPVLRPNSLESLTSGSVLGAMETELAGIHRFLRPSLLLVRYTIAREGKAGPVKQEVLVSGVVFHRTGLVVAPVLSDGILGEIILRGHDGKEGTAHLLVSDPKLGMSLLQGKGLNWFPPPFGRIDELEVGSLAVALGNGFGLEGSMSLGFVAGKNRSYGPNQGLLQITNPMNPGDGGGLVANRQGQMVGVLLSPLRLQAPDENLKTIPDSMAGISFAVPVAQIFNLFRDYAPSDVPQRPRLGLSLRTRLENGEPRLYVTDVLEGFPAFAAGVQPGDVLLRFAEQQVTSIEEVLKLLGQSQSSVKVAVLRDGKLQVLVLKLRKN